MEYQFVTNVNGEMRQVSVNIPISIELSQEHLKYVKTWSEIQMEFFTKCKELEEKRAAIEKDISETLQFTNNAKIPYNWEPLRMQFSCIFENMLNAARDAKMIIFHFPNDIRFLRDIVLTGRNYKNHDLFEEQLNSSFAFMASALEELETDFKKEKEAALMSFNASQLVPKPCGF